MLLVPRQLVRSGMTGDVPYYGGRFTPAQAYAAQNVVRTREPTGPRTAGPSDDERLAMLDELRAAGTLTDDEYDTLRERIGK